MARGYCSVGGRHNTLRGADTGRGHSGTRRSRVGPGSGRLGKDARQRCYRLRRAAELPGCCVATSVMHPGYSRNALRTADVIINTPMERPCTIDSHQVDLMKRGVIIMNLARNEAPLCATPYRKSTSPPPTPCGRCPAAHAYAIPDREMPCPARRLWLSATHSCGCWGYHRMTAPSTQ